MRSKEKKIKRFDQPRTTKIQVFEDDLIVMNDKKLSNWNLKKKQNILVIEWNWMQKKPKSKERAGQLEESPRLMKLEFLESKQTVLEL